METKSHIQDFVLSIF